MRSVSRGVSLIARAYLLRGFTLWIGVRAIASAVLALAGVAPLHLPTIARVVTVVIAVVAALAQTLRLREGILLGNLGVSPLELVAWFATAAMGGELALAVAGALVL